MDPVLLGHGTWASGGKRVTDTLLWAQRSAIGRWPPGCDDPDVGQPHHGEPHHGEPHHGQHHRTDRAGEDSPETGAVPPRTAGQLPRQHEARVRTVPITSTLNL